MVQREGTSEGFASLHRRFAATEYGQRLSQSLRWQKYKPQGLENSRWRKLLGVDVDNLGHCQLSGNLARRYCAVNEIERPGELSARDQELIVATAFVHDWGESVSGDVGYWDKTDDHTAIEKASLIDNLDALCPGLSPAHRQLIETAIEDIIFTPESRLGRIFNAIEHVGYVRTGLRASWHLANDSAPDCHENLRWLVTDTLSASPSKLINYAQDYAPVQHFLELNKASISEAFELSGGYIPATVTEAARQQRLEMFERERSIWQGWAQGQHLGQLAMAGAVS